MARPRDVFYIVDLDADENGGLMEDWDRALDYEPEENTNRHMGTWLSIGTVVLDG
jgi:hypothetical protein